MSHPHQPPLQPRRRCGTERETDPPKPYHHGRFPGAIDLRATDERWQGICRIRLCLSPLPGLSARPQGDLHRWWVSDPPLPLCSDAIGRAHHLAHPVHLVQGGLYGLAAFCPSLSLDATEVARDVLLATHGGLSLELCAVIGHIAPMALYRLVCAFGHQSLVGVLTRCGLPLPTSILADEKHSR